MVDFALEDQLSDAPTKLPPTPNPRQNKGGKSPKAVTLHIRISYSGPSSNTTRSRDSVEDDAEPLAKRRKESNPPRELEQDDEVFEDFGPDLVDDFSDDYESDQEEEVLNNVLYSEP